METFYIINQIPKIKFKLTLDELHLEVQVVENLPRNPRTLFPPRREDKDLPRSIMGYMTFPSLAKSKYSSSQATTTLFRSYSCLSSCEVGPLSVVVPFDVTKWQQRKSLRTKPSALRSRTTPIREGGLMHEPMRFDGNLNR